MTPKNHSHRRGPLATPPPRLEPPSPVAPLHSPLRISTPESPLLDQGVVELESLLRELLIEHEQLLTITQMQKRAVANADTDALAACIHQQNEIVQRVAELEKKRLALVARLADRLRLGDTAASPSSTIVPDRPTVAWLAQRFPEPTRSRIVAAADRLRALLIKLHNEHTALKDATSSLATHMEGVLRQVAGRLSHAGTYGRRGLVETRVQVVSTLDMKT